MGLPESFGYTEHRKGTVNTVLQNQVFDLFLFAGQSNMAGRGVTSPRWPQPAPRLMPGAGLEYRAISDPDKLYLIAEPFGAAENRPGGIDEPGKKTGSLVTAFVNAWYAGTGVPVLGVSASRGGSGIGEWQGREDLLSDALQRWDGANRYAADHALAIRHRFAVWCQGETDGDRGTDPESYIRQFGRMLALLEEHGMERCFLIAIGQYNGVKGYDYTAIHQAQLDLPRRYDDVVLVSDDFWTMRDRGLMKDSYHYYQQAYNEVGTAAGQAAALYTKRL